MENSRFKQTGYLLLFYLRRDWLLIVGWLIAIVGLMGGAAAKFDNLYGTHKAITAIATTLKTPAMVALFGPFTAKEPYTAAIIYASEMVVFMGLFFAIMNIYFAVKNTRAEEDNGTLELIRAHAVGQLSPLTATVLELILINLIVGILAAGSLEFAQMTGANSLGSWLFGLALAVFGMLFGTLALLMAQLASNARGATSLSYLVLGLFFIARMLTDVKNPDYTWFTVFGLIEKLAVYSSNDWLPVDYMLFLTIVFGAVALIMNTHRDVTSGLLPSRPGRKTASFFLANPFSLVLRLERTSLVIWLCSSFVLGISYGSIFGNIGNLIKTNPAIAKLMGTAAVEAGNRNLILNFAATLSVIFAVIATIPAQITLLKINNDEQRGWLEQVHARSVSRFKLFFSYVIVALFYQAACLFLALLGMGLAGVNTNDVVSLGRFFRAFAGYLPILLVISGITTLCVALLPRWQKIVWILPIYGLFSMYFGNLLNLPQWAKRVTPYGWVNRVPLEAIHWGNVLLFLCLALGLWLLSYLLYASRDLVEN
ncbi:ABC transporter permease [Liquorilactobacillus satsumensis]|uniref:ABC transporter, permease protein n=2 Tax=Liquorilactobacillus satsumensis TaxID=259059 RepID=A0A0R1UZT1_9LACO|nr:ABC transporter permease [Liquorilactobacillus satsumensis]KRL98807.1 ABC transporter, permease protein [Liquorilactobacillus satsumensis DSM 16230 = JCM 12392]MCP9328014.1 ABC transporter permease [Liquorilactobacillus satsumensis]